MDSLRRTGWIFDAPLSSAPWYHFYELYDFSVINWPAFVNTTPAILALVFFGLLHVPINVPALGISTGEDNLDVDRELIAHGIANTLSGFAGSVQNYLVYSNSLLFIEAGGSRLAGVVLAGATTVVMLIGPAMVRFIPVMIVGAPVILLGLELLQEALINTWGKLRPHEYLTVIIIIATMGIYDFVTGILTGLVLACLDFVVQTSRNSAIQEISSGDSAGSTIHQPFVQRQSLEEAGKQTLVLRLGGHLFFGTIVEVESTVRGFIVGEAFDRHLIRFIILDFSRIDSVDFSAAEAFVRIGRVLKSRNVQLIILGLDVEGDIGNRLRNVGLFKPELGAQIFERLDLALQYCEYEYLKTLDTYQVPLERGVSQHQS
ncbi:hypothetical protein ASPCAL00504 [Aspergillus calidoustus]|uniref:STAS domain-containing protein n=1 Tax=Aspergillus calidoustus TaxID=454130 RepID=A0A0U5FNA5_ASPCI|nr:hypothetical protein ASPCAL00504 [Aspergillus calidoustus]